MMNEDGKQGIRLWNSDCLRRTTQTSKIFRTADDGPPPCARFSTPSRLRQPGLLIRPAPSTPATCAPGLSRSLSSPSPSPRASRACRFRLKCGISTNAKVSVAPVVTLLDTHRTVAAGHRRTLSRRVASFRMALWWSRAMTVSRGGLLGRHPPAGLDCLDCLS